MIRRDMRTVRLRFAAILAAGCALVGLAFWPSLAEGAATFKSVVIRNTTSDPVPVVVHRERDGGNSSCMTGRPMPTGRSISAMR